MEVSNRGLAILTLATVAAVILAFASGRPGPGARLLRESGYASRARAALRDSVVQLGARLRASAARTLVESALGPAPGPPPTGVLVVGDSVNERIVRLADSLLARLEIPADAAIPLRLAVVSRRDLPVPDQKSFSRFALLPAPGSTSGCTAVRLDVAAFNEPPADLPDAPGRFWPVWGGAVGPCWYLAAFGHPGAAIRAWLDARYWDVAAELPHHRPRLAGDMGEPVMPALALRLLDQVTGSFLGGSATLQGCAGDRPQLCELALLDHPYLPGLLPDGIAGSVSVTGYTRLRQSWVLGIPSWSSRALLAMMVEDLGPERFARFWASPLTVDSAFAEVAGESLGDWYRNQIRREFRSVGVPGPRPPTFWPAVSGWLVLALVGTLWQSRRRQVR